MFRITEKELLRLTSEINIKYNQNIVDFHFNVDSFKTQYVDFNKIKENNLFISIEDLNKVFLSGNIYILHNHYYERYYFHKVKELSLVDVFFHLQKGIEETEDYHHVFLEKIIINKIGDNFVVELVCGS